MARLRGQPTLERVGVFAIGFDRVQVDFGVAPAGEVRLVLGDREVLHERGGPGALTVRGLTPGSLMAARVEAASARSVALQATTLTPPSGAPLARVATITDLHLGAPAFGVRKNIVDTSGLATAVRERCARFAVAEANATNPDLMVVKGDITNHGWHESWSTALDVFATSNAPVLAVIGNHDVDRFREVDAESVLKANGIAYPDPVHTIDLDGLRVIALRTARDDRSEGYIDETMPELLDALAESPGPALVCLHHPPERLPIPHRYPIGLVWPSARRLIAGIAAVKRDVVVTTGHTHRNRRSVWKGITVAETSSTGDYPGCWTEYVAFEDGLVQMTWRIEAPDVISWTERTGAAVGGLWRPYAAGRLSDRCFVHHWSTTKP